MSERLGRAGFDVHRGVGAADVLGILGNGDGPAAVVLRADMDALPVREETGAATLLAEATGQWTGTAVALFQPAEETTDGARAWSTAVSRT